MEVLGSRVLLRSPDPARSRRFYRDVLGLAIYREFGDPADPALVFFLGGGFLEVSGSTETAVVGNLSLWLQVRNLDAEYERLVELGADIARPPRTEPWGLREMWLRDPDGVRIVLVQVPGDHPLRRDDRTGHSGSR
jgi:catechol 2,3-dioxygenase-like lactoylglutathione lyase family enzyme